MSFAPGERWLVLTLLHTIRSSSALSMRAIFINRMSHHILSISLSLRRFLRSHRHNLNVICVHTHLCRMSRCRSQNLFCLPEHKPHQTHIAHMGLKIFLRSGGKRRGYWLIITIRFWTGNIIQITQEPSLNNTRLPCCLDLLLSSRGLKHVCDVWFICGTSAHIRVFSFSYTTFTYSRSNISRMHVTII